jgi:osmotically-inducible protein OsmY
MAAARRDQSGLLLATALGVIILAAGPPAIAQAVAVQRHNDATLQEVIVTASRERDEALTAKVVQALQDDPYIFADHVSIETENGIVRVRGVVTDVTDMRRALFLARRVAGRRHVYNELELQSLSADHD